MFAVCWCFVLFGDMSAAMHPQLFLPRRFLTPSALNHHEAFDTSGVAAAGLFYVDLVLNFFLSYKNAKAQLMTSQDQFNVSSVSDDVS